LTGQHADGAEVEQTETTRQIVGSLTSAGLELAGVLERHRDDEALGPEEPGKRSQAAALGAVEPRRAARRRAATSRRGALHSRPMSASRACERHPADLPEAHAAPPLPATADEEEDAERDREDDEPEPGALELPPLLDDQDDGPEESFEELLETLEDSDDPLDDAAASHLDVGIELSLEDSAPIGNEPSGGEEEEIDVGALHEGIIDGSAESWLVEIDGGGDSFNDDDDIDGDDGSHGDDGGTEGTGEDPADDVDERELPALDADDDGTYEGEDLLAELPGFADDRSAAWDALPWVVVDGAGAAVPCSALAVAGGFVIAGGAEVSTQGEAPVSKAGSRGRRAERSAGDRGTVLIIDPGAHTARRAGIEASATAIVVADGAIVIATRRGSLLRSNDSGKTASSLGAWGSGGAPVTLAATPGRLWVLSGGTLWSPAAGARAAEPGAASAAATPPRHDGAAASSRRLSPGPAVGDGVLRIAASEGVVVALSGAKDALHLERLRGDDERSPVVPLSGAARRAAQAEDSRLAAAAGGRAIALSGGGAICVSRDGGETFRVVDGLPPVVALAFAGDNQGTPLLALAAREQEPRAQLLYVPASAAPTVVAEIDTAAGAVAGEGRATLGEAALAWDPAREVAWIACQAGLIALTRQRKH
jgi:hypothetical protein